MLFTAILLSGPTVEAAATASSDMPPWYERLTLGLEWWEGDIDFEVGDESRDGDTTMIGGKLELSLNEFVHSEFKYAHAREDYGENETDVDQILLELRRGLSPNIQLGLGYYYWNNDYDSRGSNLETGPYLTLLAETSLGETGLSLEGRVYWLPVELGDDDHYEFVQVEGGIGYTWKQATLRAGWRAKDYYNSPDDYFYDGFLVGLDWKF